MCNDLIFDSLILTSSKNLNCLFILSGYNSKERHSSGMIVIPFGITPLVSGLFFIFIQMDKLESELVSYHQGVILIELFQGSNLNLNYDSICSLKLIKTFIIQSISMKKFDHFSMN